MDLDILSAGEDWQDKLDAAIRASHALVVIMTPEARKSDYVAYEWAFALGAGVRVIPLEFTKTDVSPRLDTLHRLDFTGKVRPWDSLLAEVEKAEKLNPTATLQVGGSAPPAVKRAILGIDSLDADERLSAIRTLAQTDHESARNALVLALKHPVNDVRMAAAAHFPDRSDPRIVAGLVQAFRSRDTRETWFPGSSLADEVAAAGVAAIPELLAAARTASGEERSEIYHALGQIGDRSVTSVLVDVLDDQDANVRLAAVQGLGRIGDPGAASALIARLADDVAEIRRAAATSLGQLKSAQAVSTLKLTLLGDRRDVRSAAARALGQIGERSAVPALLQAMNDSESDVKNDVIAALGELGDPAAVGILRPLLKPDTDGAINEADIAVMAALVRLGDTDSLATIENRLIHFRSGTSPRAVFEALETMGAPGEAVLIRVIKTNTSSLLRRDVARSLERLSTPDALDALKIWRRTHG
jgi:HEAT repeat protein